MERRKNRKNREEREVKKDLDVICIYYVSQI